MKYIDLTGNRYGRLMVVKLDHLQKLPCGKIERYYLCKCDCGNYKVIRSCSLRNGNTSSCGCYAKEMLSQRQTIHSMSKTALYKAWRNMKIRCSNPNYTDYCDYGGRGISICEEWLLFENFKKWALENGYKEEIKNGKNILSLDRIDVNKGYSPDNCRWATNKTQANNKRNNVRYYYNGKNLTLGEWAEITGICYGTLSTRVHRLNWSIEKALTEPVHKPEQKVN